MSQVSKHKLNQNIYDNIFTLFPKFVSRLSNQGKAPVAINTIFSSTERTMFAKRLAASFMLIEGYTYDQIKSKLCISNGTIGKMAEITKNADSAFVLELHKIAKEQAFSEFLESIGYKIAVALPPKGGNWSTWRKNIEEKHRKSVKGI